MPSRSILIVGSTRGLGQEVLKLYSSRLPNSHIYGTTRSSSAPSSAPNKNVSYIPSIDVGSPTGTSNLVNYLQSHSITLDTLVITAGYFATEDLSSFSWDKEESMFRISVIGVVSMVTSLINAELIASPAKIVLLSSESGSLTLRHEKEGGGNYGHHASKAALNMVGRLLALDLKEKEVAVGIVHPGFMRTEMTKGVGFDKFWDEGGAVTPDVAAKSLVAWIEDDFGMELTGRYFAPRGAGDIGTAEETMGKEFAESKGPLELPW